MNCTSARLALLGFAPFVALTVSAFSQGGTQVPETVQDPGAAEPGYGLLIPRAVFEGGVPLPAALVVMTPSATGGESWDTTTIIEESGAVTVYTGTAPGERSVLRRTGAGADSEALLEWKLGEAGYELGPAGGVDPETVVWDTKRNGDSKTKSYEQLGGNVFHKAMWFEPAYGEPGILTISANMPSIKIWRPVDGGWIGELLYQGLVGGEEHRYRDIEAGDVDGDDVDELVLATHDRGGIYVFAQTPEGLVAQRIHSREVPYFVHEIELGDVDGDGRLEIFSTPSEPNKLDGSRQLGEVLMHDYVDGAYVESVVQAAEETHAKEILAADVDGDGLCELYAAMEAKGIGGMTGGSAEIRRYDFKEGKVTAGLVTQLPGEMCRFLGFGDTDGDGMGELIASTSKDGVIKIEWSAGEWVDSLVASGLFTSGFEHAMCVFDIDGDGDDDVFSADDVNKHVYQWSWDNTRGRYNKVELWKAPSRATTISWGILPVPLKGLGL